VRHKPHFVASFAGDFVAFVESNRESAREGAKVFFTADVLLRRRMCRRLAQI